MFQIRNLIVAVLAITFTLTLAACGEMQDPEEVQAKAEAKEKEKKELKETAKQKAFSCDLQGLNYMVIYQELDTNEVVRLIEDYMYNEDTAAPKYGALLLAFMSDNAGNFYEQPWNYYTRLESVTYQFLKNGWRDQVVRAVQMLGRSRTVSLYERLLPFQQINMLTMLQSNQHLIDDFMPRLMIHWNNSVKAHAPYNSIELHQKFPTIFTQEILAKTWPAEVLAQYNY